MNTLEQQQRGRAKAKAKELIHDIPAYIESAGKIDIDTLGHTEQSRTVLRLILGATATMPHRAISYVDSALRTAQHFPDSQLQIIHANTLGVKINRLDPETVHLRAIQLGEHIVSRLELFDPELAKRTIHAVDTPANTEQFHDLATEALGKNERLRQKMMVKGKEHGGNATRYIAGHYAFQDTNILELDVLTGPDQMTDSDRIISIGCQQERNFYAARMGMQMLRAPDVATAQIFTKHLTPPYFLARDGEPLLGEFTSLDEVNDTVARRDLAHFQLHNQLIGENL